MLVFKIIVTSHLAPNVDASSVAKVDVQSQALLMVTKPIVGVESYETHYLLSLSTVNP